MTAGLVGTRLGRYEILAEIGQGGMSVVYRATDTQLRRTVALKVMHAFLAEQEEARERFHREAVAVARLRHPHIIEIFDYSGEGAEQSYIVTELVEGQALADMLKGTPLTLPEAAVTLARPVAQALQHAHEHGIIHRDLKPENILVGPSGVLKLTDFGIARMLDSHTLTMTGTLLGSPAYMAPEYVEGYATDERADLFSFGAMLYQLAVGKLPFEAPTPHALLKRIATGEHLHPQEANPEVHSALARIIEKCLARLPENRYASAAALTADLDAFLDRIGVDAAADLPRLLADPGAYCAELRAALPARYIAGARAFLARHAHGRAIEELDRALSLEPDNREVRRILDRLARRAWARRLTRDAALVLVGVAAVTWAGSALSGWYGERARAAAAAVADGGPVGPPTPGKRNVGLLLRGSGDLYVDDLLVLRGVTGRNAIELAPGEHRLRFANPSKSVTAPLRVDEEGPVPPVELDITVPVSTPAKLPPPAKIREVEFNAAGLFVDVYVDDDPKPALRDKMGVFRLPLAYGKRRLRFVNPYYQPEDRELLVDEDDPPQRVVIRLLPLPARLFVRGAPDGAVVEVAGKRSLINERTRDDPIHVPLELEVGESAAIHEVVVRADGQKEFRARLTFRPGEEQNLDVALQPL